MPKSDNEESGSLRDVCSKTEPLVAGALKI